MTKQPEPIEPSEPVEEVTNEMLDDVTGGAQAQAPQMAQQGASSCSCHDERHPIFGRGGVRIEKGPQSK